MPVNIERKKNIIDVKVTKFNHWYRLINILDKLYNKNIRLIFYDCDEIQNDYNLVNIIKKYNILSLEIIDTELKSNNDIIFNIINSDNNNIKEYYFLNNNFNDIEYLRMKLKNKQVTYHLEEEYENNLTTLY